jgi:hypothetical protein
VQIPRFPEAKHPIVQSLSHCSDRQLISLFQLYPEQGKYFTAIFCRYSPIVYTLISHVKQSPVQRDYLFLLTWRHLFYEMRGLGADSEDNVKPNFFQSWTIETTMAFINQLNLPPVELINYDLEAASPPLWCYLEQALEKLPPLIRLIVAMADNFHWSAARISGYLRAEGDILAPAEVLTYLNKGHQLLEDALPEDIRKIYLSEASLNQLATEAANANR